MAKQDSPWRTISMTPLTGVLDLRSRPAEVPVGGFRWGLNFAVTPEGKLCRREGFTKAFTDYLYDSMGQPLTDPNHPGSGVFYHNHDHHHQGGTREPITFLYEHTTSAGERILFDGTQSRLSRLDQSTGYWGDLLTGMGGFGSRWMAASSQDYVLFTNGTDAIYAHPAGVGGIATIPELVALGISAAKVIIEFNGIVLIMNVTVGGSRKSTSIYWSDLNAPLSWNPATADTLAGNQDLPFGDEILAAAPMLNSLYIYTRRAIWRCTVSGTQEKTFDFQMVYQEPKNQTGCLVYPYTLVSTGTDHYYMSRESIYHYNPYMAKPECEDADMDWLHRASGAIYTKLDMRMNGVSCNSPVAEYVPTRKEIWFSWPSGTRTVNNWTLVAQVFRKTANLVDEGLTAMVNFRRTPVGAAICNEVQDFIVASATDYCLKDWGGVFYREYLSIAGLLTDDPPLQASFLVYGYYSELRGQIPTGLYDRDKKIRRVLIDSDDSEQSPPPCNVHVWIGNSQTLTDPNDTDDICAPQWRDLKTVPLKCQDTMKISEFTGLDSKGVRRNLRSSNDKEWPCYEQGRFLYFRVQIENEDGSAAIGGDSCVQRIDFDVLAVAKP